MPSATSYTGFQRKRTSSRAVRIGDRLARACITVGGFATILAVGTVCFFLVWVVLPLFGSAEVAAAGKAETAPGPAPLHLSVDPYGQFALLLQQDGRVDMVALHDGTLVGSHQLLPPGALQSWTASGNRVCLGTRSGALQLAQLSVDASFVGSDALPANVQALQPGTGIPFDGGWFERTGSGGRLHQLAVKLDAPIQLAEQPLIRVDFVLGSSGRTVLAVTADQQLVLHRVRRSQNLITGEIKTTTSGSTTALADLGLAGAPDHALLVGAGDNVYLLDNDGTCLRLDTRDLAAPIVAERCDLLPDPRDHITALGSLIGKSTLLVGDNRGVVRSYFRSRQPAARGSDGQQLDLAHEFPKGAGAVVSLSPSERSRLFLAGYRDGALRVFQATSQRLVAAAPPVPGLGLATMAPRDDGFVAMQPGRLLRFAFDAGHPEVTLASVFLPVRYEDTPAPKHAWQSTGGTDDFEPKFGLWPLLFGTLKGTFYCLLFGVPLALLAAIYTSEFLHPRLRSRIKPMVEMMASLPSVVLGFLAALVFAPLVAEWLVTLIAMVATVPLVWLLGAQLLGLMSPTRRLLFERHRLVLVAAGIPIAVLIAAALGAAFEAIFFGGSFRDWLAAKDGGDPSHAFGGCLMLALPIGALLAALFVGRTFWFIGHRAAGLLRLGIGGAATLALAVPLAWLLATGGFELRGTLVGAYDQRNALVVGIVMGFAVIPIIYTIAEDALTAVPEHLRAASLGAGATPWQTAVRIILPTAMSGIFSAVMIGLGRAVGETMIVLMAAGNTPVLEMNLFNGFRTLAANIAFELPEAVRDSSHYRMLYLAALVLFALTFTLNTLAEFVRQRFRRRAWQL